MFRLSLFLAAAGLALLLIPIPQPAAEGGADSAYGRALFMAKGCAMCHHHAALADSGQFAQAFGSLNAPDLSSYSADPAFVRRWLADPPSVRPGTNMPKLDLQPDEIAALIAFLQAGRAGSP